MRLFIFSVLERNYLCMRLSIYLFIWVTARSRTLRPLGIGTVSLLSGEKAPVPQWGEQLSWSTP